METIACKEALLHVLNCEIRMKAVTAYNVAKAGSTLSKAKSEAARLNGAKGGRPRKIVIDPNKEY